VDPVDGHVTDIDSVGLVLGGLEEQQHAVHKLQTIDKKY
jgi:hypothetical protein